MGLANLASVLILSLDTTTRGGSAAVLDDDRVLAVVEGDATRTHGERLPSELQRALSEAGCALPDVDLLAVAAGPGAFTGLRIGMATMQGLALATGRPVVGVSGLDALALTAFEELQVAAARIGCWVDAARGEVFGGLFDVTRSGTAPSLTLLSGPEVGEPAVLWSDWRALGNGPIVIIGDAVARSATYLSDALRVLPHPLLAPAVGRLARQAALTGAPQSPHDLQPLYVRRPDVERLGSDPPPT